MDIQPLGYLFPITPETSSRYNRQHNIHLYPISIEPRQPDPRYPTSHWFTYTHPEGQLYHAREGRLRTVTDEDIEDPATLDALEIWIAKVENMLASNMCEVTNDMELMIELRGDDCGYYIVDRAARTVSWAETICTSDVGIPDVSSQTNLATSTESSFWRHVEFYPSHFGGLSEQVLDSLHCVFSHAVTDQLTSTTSTFPYKVQDCNHFLSVLAGLRGRSADAHATCVIARLWCLVCLHRTSVHYGTSYARLNRNQRILEYYEEEHRLTPLASTVTCRISDDYRARLDDLYTDDMVYGDHWRNFIEYALDDWKRVSLNASYVLSAHAALIFLPACAPLVLASAVTSALAGLCALFLMHRHAVLASTSINTAATYLRDVCDSRHRFQFTALAMAAPRAIHFWGVALLLFNMLYLVFSAFGLIPAMLIIGAALGCCTMLTMGTAAICVAPEDMILPYSASSAYMDCKV